MMPTYALARRVLISDKGLQQLFPTLPVLELQARILLSGWRSRYWTHQELVLSNYALVLLDGPSISPCDDLIYHKYHMSMSDVQLELMDSNIRIRACAGLADHESAAVETRDIIHFVRIWNGFSGKASSLQADMHGILANLLGLSATEVVNILASQ
jgi:hypothetical protein